MYLIYFMRAFKVNDQKRGFKKKKNHVIVYHHSNISFIKGQPHNAPSRINNLDF